MIELEGIPDVFCSECQNPARVEYEVGKQKFQLCLACLMEMERQTHEELSRLLKERPH